MKVVKVIFKPAEPLSLRWLGNFTWMATGPGVRASSEPLPLPSTVVGALINALAVKYGRVNPPQGFVKPRNLIEVLGKLLGNAVGLSDSFVIRGPYLELTGGRYALHSYPGKLVVFNSRHEIEDVIELGKAGKATLITLRGTALRHDSRTVMPHLLYSETLIDYLSIEGGAKGVVAEVLYGGNGGTTLTKRTTEVATVRFGGEGRVARVFIEVSESTLPVTTSSDHSTYVYVASPILLSTEKVNSIARMLGRGSEEVVLKAEGEECYISMPTIRDIKEGISTFASKLSNKLDPKELIKLFRVKIGLIAPGFDTIRGSLRELYPSILPGSILKISKCKKPPLTISTEPYNKLGWGTIITL